MKKTGDEYFDSEDFLDMLGEYEKAVNTGMPVFLDAEELAEIADYYQWQGQADEAEKAIRHALSLSPGAIAPLTYRIHEALWKGDVEAAKGYLSQIVEKDDPDYIYDRAEIMIAEERIDEADHYLREQLKTVPQDEYQDYVVDVANIYSDYGVNEKAMEWLSRAKHEDSADFKELIARTLFGLGKYKESEKLFDELIDRDPFQKRYWTALASAQFMNEDYSNSIQSSEYAIAIDPDDPEGLMAKANGLYRLGNYEEALEYFTRYVERVPDDEFARMQQGTCLLNMERYDEAIDMLEQSLELASPDSPYLPDIYQELSFAYADKGDADKALACLDKTDELDCDHVEVLVVKGHVLLATGHVEKAGHYFRKAVVESEKPQATLLRVIVSLYDNKYVDGAYQMFQRFFAIVPDDNTEGYAYMALCCYDLKKNDEFMKYLKKACEVNPKECRIVLAHLFPNGVAPEDYYEYMRDQITRG